MPTSLCKTLDAVNPVLYPSIDTILCIMLTMSVTSATAERSFSVLRRLKTYVRSTMNNDRLSSLALIHIYPSRFQCGFRQSYGEVRVC
jgi:hypothetical protein